MLLDKEHKNQEENKLTFVLTYCPVFQKLKPVWKNQRFHYRRIKGIKKYFVMFLLQRFVKKISKDKLVRTSFPTLKNSGDPCGERNFQVCQFIVKTDTLSLITAG